MPNRLVSPGWYSSPPGSSSEKPRTTLQACVAWQYMASLPGGSSWEPRKHTKMDEAARQAVSEKIPETQKFSRNRKSSCISQYIHHEIQT